MRINNKRLFYSVIVTVCLHLVFLGIRVPGNLGAHTPKPHSRAIIETTVKDSQEEGSKKNLVDCACQNSINLETPTQFNLATQQEAQNYSFIPSGHSKARAPPALIA